MQSNRNKTLHPIKDVLTALIVPTAFALLMVGVLSIINAYISARWANITLTISVIILGFESYRALKIRLYEQSWQKGPLKIDKAEGELEVVLAIKNLIPAIVGTDKFLVIVMTGRHSKPWTFPSTFTFNDASMNEGEHMPVGNFALKYLPPVLGELAESWGFKYCLKIAGEDGWVLFFSSKNISPRMLPPLKALGDSLVCHVNRFAELNTKMGQLIQLAKQHKKTVEEKTSTSHTSH